MSFVSLDFIIFLCVLLAVYYIFPAKVQKYILLLGSLFFYFVNSLYAFLAILVTSFTVYFTARLLDNWKKLRQKIITVITIILNVAILVVLKYTNLISQLEEVLLVTEKENIGFWSLKIVVPLGISFYTLSLVGYLIDVYRKKYPAEKNYFNLLLFTVFFPHILQGPIARYDQLGSQLVSKHKFQYEKVAFGAQLMIWGYIKKMVIADRAAIFVDAVYAEYSLVPGTTLFIASLLYTIQIYADFSGCVDIARGVAEMLGIDLVNNFMQPYFATSINDFWRRWHISLSSWFRDYVYIPLGGNRKGTVRRWTNVLIVFLVSGFWHGVGLNYIFWGLLHGIYQIIGYILKPLKNKFYALCKISKESYAFQCAQIFVTFILVNFAWIFFRITNLKQAAFVVGRIVTNISPWVLTDNSLLEYGISKNAWFLLLLFIIIMLIVDKLHENKVSVRCEIAKLVLPVRWIIYFGAIIMIMMFGIYGLGYDASSFIYMNF